MAGRGYNQEQIINKRRSQDVHQPMVPLPFGDRQSNTDLITSKA